MIGSLLIGQLILVLMLHGILLALTRGSFLLLLGLQALQLKLHDRVLEVSNLLIFPFVLNFEL